MSTPLDQMLQELIYADLEQRTQTKQAQIKEKSARKRTGLDPNFSIYDPDNFNVLDSDTVYDKTTGETIRFHAGEGRFADAFETSINRYESDPGRANSHRKAYAKLFGRDEADVSNEDLVNAGLSQKEAMLGRLQSLRGQGMGFTRTGKDQYGRTLAKFDDNSVLEPILGTEGNAGYLSDYNWKQIQEDERAGKTDALAAPDRSTLRALTGDALTSFWIGGSRAASGLAQGFVQPFVKAATGGKGSDLVDGFFRAVNEGIDYENQLLSSEGKLARERFDQKEQQLLRPLYDIRRKAYKNENPDAPEWKSHLSAIIDEAADRIEYLIEEPGRILDASLESLPYMIGVGAVGRAASMKAAQVLQGPRFAAMNAASKAKALRRVQALTGIATVSLTEGLTNASDVYNSVSGMSEEEAQQSEKYQALRKRGLTHKQAARKLASKAFNDTLVTTMLIAGVASGVTGAAGFESRLFTRLGQRAKGKISSDNLLFKWGKRTGRAVGSFTGPGSREAVEETAQSGGGEFLAQLAEFNTTGLGEVGPGVGTAAGEGGLVGFVSGAVAGGAGTTARGISAAGRKVADVLGDKDNLHDEIQLQTPIHDANGNAGGTVLDARKNISEAKKEGKTPLDLLQEAIKAGEKGPVLAKHIKVYRDSVVQDKTIPEKMKETLLTQADAALDRAGSEATVQARAILEKFTSEDIQNSTQMKQILNLAWNYGSLKQDIKKSKVADEKSRQLFHASSKVAEAVEAAERQMVKTTGSVDGKPQAQVIEEKMGHAMTENGPGLKGHVSRIEEAITNDDSEGYFNADQDLLRFIATQSKKLQALNEMGNRITIKGESVNKVVEEVNQQFGTDLKWEPMNPKLAAYNAEVAKTNKEKGTNHEFRLSGSMQLAADIRAELNTMQDIRDALAEQAQVWNADSPAIKEAVKKVKAEPIPDLDSQPFIPGVSPEGRDTSGQNGVSDEETVSDASEASKKPATKEKPISVREANAERTAQPEQTTQTTEQPDELNPPPPSDDDIPYIPGVTDSTEPVPEPTVQPEPDLETESKPKKVRRKKKGGNTVASVDPDAPFSLNEGQKAAFNKALKFFEDKTKRAFSIIGSAGTGKTTLVNELIAQLKKDQPGIEIVLSSPTHRANSVIQSKNPDKNVETLHKVLGLSGRVDLENFDASKVQFAQRGDMEIGMPYDGVLVIDESSMINDDLFKILMETAEAYGTQILFLGDMAQLGPVNQATDSKALTSTDESAELTQVMRAKNSQLLDESVFVREEGEFSNENDMDEDQNGIKFMNKPKEFIDKAIELFKSDEFKDDPLLVRVVAYTNNAVAFLNKRIRTGLYGKDAPSIVDGEILMAYNSFGDNIKNSLDYQVERIISRYDGELFGVKVPVVKLMLKDSIEGTNTVVDLIDPNLPQAKREELTRAAFKAIEDAKRDRRLWKRFYEQSGKFALPFALGTPGGRTAVKRTFDYGYAHTIHKSQGGTYTYIMVVGSNIDKARSLKDKERLRYVAVTRAEKGAFVITNDEIIEQDDQVEEAAASRIDTSRVEAETEDDGGEQRTSEASEAAREPESEGSAANTQEEETPAPAPTIPLGTTVKVNQEAEDAAVPHIPGLVGAPESVSEPVKEETSTETPVEKKTLTGEALEKAQRNIYELQRLEADSDLFTDPQQVRLTSPKLTFAVRQEMAKGKTAGEAAAVLLARYENAYESSVFDAPASNPQPEAETVLLDKTVELANGKRVKSTIMTSLEPAVDFLSDTTVKLLGLYVGKRKLPTSNWTEEELIETREALKAKFKKVKLPSSIRRGLRLRAKETKNLLAAVPGIMGLLNNTTTKRAFAIRTKANAKEEQALNGVIDFVNSFIQALQSDNEGIVLGLLNALEHKNSPFKREKLGEDGIAITNRLHEYALQYFLDPDTGKINEDLAAIMAIEAGQWLATAGASTLNNREDVINELIGRPKGSSIQDADRLVFGNGTLMSNVLSTIGQRVLSQANLSLNSTEADPLFLDELHSSIGAMALSTLKMMDLIDIVPVTERVRERLRGDPEKEGETEAGASNETLNLVHITTAGQAGTDQFFEESYENKDTRLAFTGARRILGEFFSTVSYVRGPLLAPAKAPRKVSRARTNIPDAQADNMGENSKFGWRPVQANIALLDQFEDEDFEREIMETEDPDKVQKNLRESARSNKARNKRSLAMVREWVAQNGNKTFHFAYHMIRSGRIYIDSNTINPQADKLHRFMFAMNDWKVTMDTRYPNPKGTAHENFLIAVALGLDINTDSQTREQILEQVTAALEDKDIREVIDLLKQDRKYEVVRDENGKIIKNEPAKIASVLPSGEKAHGLAALKAYADYELALEIPGRDSIDLYLPMETDGKTNGFSSNLLQLPPSSPAELEMVKEMLRATGVYFKDDAFENYPGFAQDKKNFDNYQQVSNETTSIVGILRQGQHIELDNPGPPKWESFLNSIRKNKQSVKLIEASKFIIPDRNFAKIPLMVVAYGAGFFSIRQAILDKAETKFYEDLQKVTTVGEAAVVITRLQMVTDATKKMGKQSYKDVLQENYNELSQQEDIRAWALEYTMSPADRENFRNGLDAVYGHALQRALENKLGPMQQVRKRLNEAVYLMNLAFTKNFKRMIEQQERILDRTLSDRERKQILNKMIKQGMVPLIKTPLSKSQLDSLEVTSSGNIIIGKDKDQPRRGRAYFNRPLQIRGRGFSIKNGKIKVSTPAKQESLIGSLTGYSPNMDIGVGALVKMIHSSDGAVNGSVMGNHPILNVHDAQVGNFNEIDKIAHEANETFYKTHRDWNLAQETMEALQRLLPLLDEGDPRLSKEDKAELHKEFKEYLLIYSKEGDRLEKYEGQELTDKWLTSLQGIVKKTNEAKENLFSQIKSVNQFAKEGTKEQPVEFTIPRNDPGAVNPRSKSVIEAVSSVKEMLALMRDQQANVWTEKKREMVSHLTILKNSGGDIQAALNDWMAPKGMGHAPAAEDMLDVLFEVFHDDFINDTHLNKFRDMITLLRPMLTQVDAKTGEQRRVYLRLGGAVTLGSSEGHYDNDAGHILINENAEDTVSAILHEIIHAANVKELEKLQEADSEIFQELLKEARDWLRASRNAKEGSPTWVVAQEIITAVRADKGDGNLRMVTEYVAYLNATLATNQEGGRRFIFTSDKLDAVNALARSLQSKSGKNVFHSSSDNTNDALFEETQGQKLTAGTAVDTMELVRRLETVNISPAMKNMFKRVFEQFVLPGLVDIDEIILKIAENPDGSRNLGKWLTDPSKSEIYLERVNQAYLNSPLEMSMEEVFLHEVLHAIFETALEDPSISKEVERLIELVHNQLMKDHDGQAWKAFLPAEQGTDPALDEKLAKKQYNHIFLNGVQSHQEFMAMGLTNPQFVKILSDIDDKAPEKILGDGIIDTLFNLLERALQFIREDIMRQDARKVSSSLEVLAQRIIKANANMQAQAKEGADYGYISKKLESLNDAALRKMASMVNTKLQKWAEANSLSGDELNKAAKDKNVAAQLLLAARTATASTLDEKALRGFREAFESSITGIKKDHWLYQMLTEILPWADRNRGWIDALRNSERLIDMVRQQKFEHTRTALKSYFDPKVMKKMSKVMRENITNVLIKTDLSVFMEGENAMYAGDLLNLLKSPQAVATMINTLVTDLQSRLTADQWRLFDFQSEGLATLMVTNRAGAIQAMNVDVIIQQLLLDEKHRTAVKDEAEVKEALERLTSLRAFQKLNNVAVADVMTLMEAEMQRPVRLNGFNGVMSTASTFKQLSLQKLFGGNPILMQKGYTSDITDPEIEIKAVMDTPQDREAMRQLGYTEIKGALPRAAIDDGPVMVLYKKKKGISRFSKSVMSLTGQQKQGQGMFDSAFAVSTPNVSKRVTAAQTHNKIAGMTVDTQDLALRIMKGQKAVTTGVHVVPLFNEKGEMMDFRYLMEEATKREHLKKRNMFDEVLPRMMSSIEDKVNTKIVNHEAVDLLYEEWIAARNSENKEDFRFIAVGANSKSPAGQELWNLLPKETKLYAREVFGADMLVMRDDAVNLVLGFRKIAWSDNKILAPAAPVVDVAEKIWLEVMQWVRFRIAVLTPEVVIGNMVSNWALLLSQGIPPRYIIRESKKAIIGMRKYQKDLRARNELDLKVANLKAQGLSAVHEEQKLIRLNHAIRTNPVSTLVEEGMFTSIVEEFGMDEDSNRRQLTTKALDKFGGITGAHGVVKVAQEMWMVPGSETGQMALMATQYGDFVGRYVQYNWNMRGVDKNTAEGKVKERQVIHDALDTFIYYNVPQNRILQFMNDNGLMMFTKFFFRIQHIVGRVFRKNPVQASITLGLQGMAGGLTGSRTAEENISNYAFFNNLGNKFQSPWDHVAEGDLWVPTILKWIPDVFLGE